MGQQQLLLVILVTIIVGIATVVAINTFSAASENANVDAVRNDLLSMAAAAQQYYMKPDMMGGGGNSFADITFRDMGSVPCNVDASDDMVCENENGKYTIQSGADATDMDIKGEPSQAGGSITITIEQDDASMGDYTGS
jgi:Tfp pilus assembly protein PilE